MGCGTVDKFVETVENVVSGTVGAAEDIVREVPSAGLIEFDTTTGQLGLGRTGEFLEHTVKEVTGANAAEEANKQAQKQFEASKSAAEKAQVEAKARTARDQLAASRLAGSARKSGKSAVNGANKGSLKSSSVSKLGSDGQDFLGL